MGRTLSPKQVSSLIETKPQTLHVEDIPSSSYLSPGSKKGIEGKFSRTDTEAVSNLVKNHPLNRLKQPNAVP